MMRLYLVFTFVAVVSFNACSTRGTGSRLSEREVVRMADAEARGYGDGRLQDFERAAPKYLPQDDIWEIDYDRRKTAGAGPGEFTVRVDAKTKETIILVSDPAFPR